LPTDEVHVGDGGAGVGRTGGDQPLTLRRLSPVVGRGVEVDHQLGAPGRGIGDGAGGAPRVLTYGDAHGDAGHLVEQADGSAGGERPPLVEDPVVGQELLVGDADDGTVEADGR